MVYLKYNSSAFVENRFFFSSSAQLLSLTLHWWQANAKLSCLSNITPCHGKCSKSSVPKAQPSWVPQTCIAVVREFKPLVAQLFPQVNDELLLVLTECYLHVINIAIAASGTVPKMVSHCTDLQPQLIISFWLWSLSNYMYQDLKLEILQSY